MRTRSSYYYDHYEGLSYDDGIPYQDPDFPDVNHEAQRELMAYSEGRFEGYPAKRPFHVAHCQPGRLLGAQTYALVAKCKGKTYSSYLCCS